MVSQVWVVASLAVAADSPEVVAASQVGVAVASPGVEVDSLLVVDSNDNQK